MRLADVGLDASRLADVAVNHGPALNCVTCSPMPVCNNSRDSKIKLSA